MSTTITYSSGTITPAVVDGYSSARSGGTLLHWVSNVASPDVTLRPADLRSGSLRLVFPDDASSAAAEMALSAPEVFTLASTDLGSIPMAFVVPETGQILRELDDATRRVWVLTVDFQEV